MPRPEPPDLGWDIDLLKSTHRNHQLTGQDSYEDACVRQVLKLIGRPAVAYGIAKEVEARVGERKCNFDVFQEFVPNFPIQFGCSRKLLGLKFLAIPDLFNKFKRTPIFQALEEVAAHRWADEFDSGPVCLIFKFEGTKEVPGPKGGKFMVAHTSPENLTDDRTRIICRTTLLGRSSDVVIDTLESLLTPYRDAWAI